MAVRLDGGRDRERHLLLPGTRLAATGQRGDDLAELAEDEVGVDADDGRGRLLAVGKRRQLDLDPVPALLSTHGLVVALGAQQRTAARPGLGQVATSRRPAVAPGAATLRTGHHDAGRGRLTHRLRRRPRTAGLVHGTTLPGGWDRAGEVPGEGQTAWRRGCESRRAVGVDDAAMAAK